MKPNWFYILLALAPGPRYGTAIQDDARRLSDGAVRLWPATLYGSLEELVRLAWIEELAESERPDGGSGRERFYRITAAGASRSRASARGWKRWRGRRVRGCRRR